MARGDHHPLTREAAEAMWAWGLKVFDATVNYRTSDGWAPGEQLATPASFPAFSREFYEWQNDEQGRLGFDALSSPL